MRAIDTVIALLRTAGGAAPRRRLLDLGATPRGLAASVQSGRVIRPMTGWYAVADAPLDLVRAVRVGGCLAATSAARHHGMLVPASTILHVAVAANAARLRDADDRFVRFGDGAGVRVHWVDGLDREALVVDPVPALLQVAQVESDVHTIAVMDSALRLGLVTTSELRTAAAASLPASLARLVAEADPRSEAFAESVARVGFRRAGLRCEPQWSVAGLRGDLLVGERHIVEIDGHAFHSSRVQIEADRIREARLTALGFHIVRFTHRQILEQWDEVLDTLRDALAFDRRFG